MVYFYLFADVEPITPDTEVITLSKEESIFTADMLELFNDMFDSVNGDIRDKKVPLRSPITETSAHHEFWISALKTLKCLEFLDPKTMKKSPNVKTLGNWILTIRSFQALWKKLKGDNFSELRGRSLTQDALENCFGQIRTLNCRNVNPTCEQFSHSFKTLFINNFYSRRTIGADCEEDTDRSLLEHLQQHDTILTDEQVQSFTDIIPFPQDLKMIQTDCDALLTIPGLEN